MLGDWPTIEGWPSADTRTSIVNVWERLPLNVRRSLADVVFTEAPAAEMKGRLADAGQRDIRIKAGLRIASDAVIVGILAHELGHVAGCHFQRVVAGAMTPEAAELEADAYALGWGFGAELRARKQWIGR